MRHDTRPIGWSDEPSVWTCARGQSDSMRDRRVLCGRPNHIELGRVNHQKDEPFSIFWSEFSLTS